MKIGPASKDQRTKSRFERYFFDHEVLETPLFVAEISANHGGSLKRALEQITLAKQAGADAVKIQTYTPSSLTLNCSKEDFSISEGLWKGQTLWQLYEWAHTPPSWHSALFAQAKKEAIALFSTPFSLKDLELLESLACPVYKIASFEMCDLELVKAAAKTQKPLVVSTGMATLKEVEQSVRVILEAGCRSLTLLHCISSYPTKLNESKIEQLSFLKRWLQEKILGSLQEEERQHITLRFGLSDHSMSHHCAMFATAQGASLIEKHFIDSRQTMSADRDFSLEPQEFAQMITNCCQVREMLGSKSMEVVDAAWSRELTRQSVDLQERRDAKLQEERSLIFRRSLYLTKALRKGELLTREHVASIRPGYGLAPSKLDQILGRRAKRDLPWAHALKIEDLEEER